ncbi:sulfotransferase family 2 domain-containing protein [Paracoccus pacificus]|uniref:Sulfotransferase family 2 domain-containing protein n=1 Tax=Paracoccus pacificus TaxID=1463598 RepID=A0ABW4R2Y6_9RHOB
MSFTSFVMLAGMRTGSNLLEATLNAVPGVTCHGEAYNPAFVGYPRRDDLLGVTLEQRDAKPLHLLKLIRSQPGLNGFRYFNDHDPRILKPLLDDPDCAKIVLTRNPAESYVSLAIARATGQWKLGDVRRRKQATATFDAGQFETHLEKTQAFQLAILHGLQSRGQTAFYIDYEDLHDPAVLSGLMRWLGLPEAEISPSAELVPQNPQAMAEKVGNYDEMARSLARLDRFNLSRTPNFEPRRGPAVPSFRASDAGAGLIYMPVRGGPVDGVSAWLADLGPETVDFTQKTLREWKKARNGHRSFTVLRHPLLRGWSAFSAQVLDKTNAELIAYLSRGGKDPGADPMSGFADFLEFVRQTLNGQTPFAVDPSWASQTEVIAGFARFGSPDHILREEEMAEELPRLAAAIGITNAPEVSTRADFPDALLADKALMKAARAAWARDFVDFGFPESVGRLKKARQATI